MAEQVERKIIIGCITSTEYLQQIKSYWDIKLLESSTARQLAMWVWEYFDKYNKAPLKDIEGIYYEKLKEGKLAKDVAEEIEEEILPGLSEEYTEVSFNLNYLLDQTEAYFKERRLSIHLATIEALLEKGQVVEAEQYALDYTPGQSASKEDIDLSTDEALDRIEKAFTTTADILIKYPRQLGVFWNHQMVRGRFLAFLASEKKGKSFWLLDIAIRASRQGRRVAFFQAGDMSEDEQLKRICVYLAKKSDKERYCGEMWEPCRDCVHNQRDTCDKEERECDFGIFEDKSIAELRYEIQQDELIEAYKDNKDYVPCHNCEAYIHNKWGVPWLKSVTIDKPLTVDEAQDIAEEFFINNQRRFKLSTHPNGTLSTQKIRAQLSVWEKQDGFVPDVILVDYADLLTVEGPNSEFRHKQNTIWMNLRSLSQEKHCLVVTATQADADSYKRDRLQLSNFSEDKRKYAHVSAMYGLNQDAKDREKKIGLMRINEIVVREGDFSNSHEVTVLQNLKRGRPFLGSYL